MLTGIQGLSFRGYPYYKIKCTDATQAKKLMSQMQAALKTTDYFSGSKGDEIIVKSMQNAQEVKAVLNCMSDVNKPKGTVGEILNTYSKFKRKEDQPVQIVNVRL